MLPVHSPPIRTAARPQPRGFTLIELMVVVAVMGTLAMFAAPSFSTMLADQRVKSAANELQALLLYARAEAIYKGSESSVAVSGQRWVVSLGDDLLREAVFPDSVTAEAGSAGGVVFAPIGRAKPAGTSKVYKVSISATNGSGVQCLSVSSAGLVSQKKVAPGQDCP